MRDPFTPEIVTVLSDLIWVDLGSGKTVMEISLTPEMAKTWYARNGADVKISHRTKGLIGRDLAVARVDAKRWNDMSPGELTKILSEVPAKTLEFGGDGPKPAA